MKNTAAKDSIFGKNHFDYMVDILLGVAALRKAAEGNPECTVEECKARGAAERYYEDRDVTVSLDISSDRKGRFFEYWRGWYGEDGRFEDEINLRFYLGGEQYAVRLSGDRKAAQAGVLDLSDGTSATISVPEFVSALYELVSAVKVSDAGRETLSAAAPAV